MFSGIIQHVGTVVENSGHRFGVAVKRQRARLGDSISINGACLTVTKIRAKGGSQTLFFDLSRETLQRTTLGKLKKGSPVNVEPALKLGETLGGHLVQGHVDGVGEISAIKGQNGQGKTMNVKAPREIMRQLIYKGSVAVDGVSLTVARILEDGFQVALIPYTLEHTNLKALAPRQKVNLEADIIGKYVSKYLKRK